MNTANKWNICRVCVDHLRAYLGGQDRIRADCSAKNDNVLRRDLVFVIDANHGMKLAGECIATQRLVNTQAENLINRLAVNKNRVPTMIFATWIPDAQADRLRKAGIFFVDTVGNAYLKIAQQAILVDVRGRRPTRGPEPGRGRLDEAGGLKIIHFLLTQVDALKCPYRTIAREAGTALGTAAIVLKELRNAGHLVRGPEGVLRLDRRQDLLDLFVRGYALKLRPACRPIRYRHEEKAPRPLAERLARIFRQREVRWAVTGGFAAGELTHYLETDTLTLFLDETGRDALVGERMLPDPDGGNLTILDYFAPCVTAVPAAGRLPLATPLLVYAELLNDGRPRELETAQRVYNRFIQGNDQ
jgi:hypothetical protein